MSNKKNIFKNNAVSVDSENKYQIPVYSQIKKNEKKILEKEAETESLQHSDLNDEVLSEHYDIEDKKEEEPKAQEISEEHLKEIEKMYEDADRYAEKTHRDAYRSAEIILNHTLSTAKQELEEAARQGFAEGFEEGRRQAESVIAPALKKIETFMNSIFKVEESMLYEFREKMFVMVSEAAKKLIHKEIKENDSYIVSLFSDAMRDMRAEDFVTITVSDYDIEFVTAHKHLFLSEIGELNDFKIIADKDSPKGTLIIETEKSVVDASIGVQLKNIEALFERLKLNLSIEEIKESVSAAINAVDKPKAGDAGESKKNSPFISEKANHDPVKQNEEMPVEYEDEYGEDEDDDSGFDDLMMSEEEFEKLNLGSS